MKYVGWILILVGVGMMLFSGVKAYDDALVGLNQTNAIVAAIQPWFWMFVVGQIVRVLKFETLSRFPQAARKTNWLEFHPLVLSWLVKMAGIVIIMVLGLRDFATLSSDGSSVDFSYSEIRPIPVFIGILIVLGGEYYFRSGNRND